MSVAIGFMAHIIPQSDDISVPRKSTLGNANFPCGLASISQPTATESIRLRDDSSAVELRGGVGTAAKVFPLALADLEEQFAVGGTHGDDVRRQARLGILAERLAVRLNLPLVIGRLRRHGCVFHETPLLD